MFKSCSAHIRAAVLAALLAVPSVLSAEPYVFLPSSDNSEIDTLVLGKISSAPTKYFGVSAVGVRVPAHENCELVGVDIPVISHKVASFDVRVYGNERGGSVPNVMLDLASPVHVTTSSAGLQVIHVDFAQATLIKGGQYFIVVENISEGVDVLSTTDTFSDTCRCQTEVFTQQVVRRGASWVTAPYTFPWSVRSRSLQQGPSVTFKLDTLHCKNAVSKNQSSRSSSYYVQVGDVNGDSHYDILSPGGLFLGRGSRSFARDTTLLMSSGLWTMMPFNPPYLVNVSTGGTTFQRKSIVVDKTLAPVDVLSIVIPATTKESRIVAVWPLVNAILSKEPQNHRLGVVWCNGNVPKQATLTVFEINNGRSNVLFTEPIPIEGEIRSVLTSPQNPELTDLSIVSESGISVLRCRISNASVEFENKTETLTHVLDVPGPGLEYSSDEAVILLSPVTVSAVSSKGLKTTLSKKNEESVEQIVSVDETWMSDRRSSIVRADFDGDGRTEVLFPTSDSCWPVHVVSLEPRSSSEGSATTFRIDGINALAGCLDVACLDIDHDGLVDIVGFKNDKVVLLWNQHFSGNSIGGSQSVSNVSPLPMIRGVGIGRFVAAATSGQSGLSHATLHEANAAELVVVPTVFDRSCSITVGKIHVGSTYRIDIVSTNGVLVRKWDITAMSDQLAVVWDGLDNNGAPVSSANYIVQLRGDNVSMSKSIQRVR